MSAGNFVQVAYSASYGNGNHIHPIKLQPETLAADIGGTTNNAAENANIDTPISAIVSASRRGLGLHPRIIYAKIVGTPPTGYSTNAKCRIVALSEAFYNEATIGGTLNYLGKTWEITGFGPELVR